MVKAGGCEAVPGGLGGGSSAGSGGAAGFRAHKHAFAIARGLGGVSVAGGKSMSVVDEGV